MPDLPRQGIPIIWCPAELEPSGDVAVQAATAQVLTSGTRSGVLEQALVVPLDGRGHRLDEALATLPLRRLSGRRVLQLQSDLGREVLDGTDEVDMAGPLDERDHVTGLVAAEAAVSTDLLADVERRRLFGVERAQPDEVAPDLAQRHDLADDVDERHGGLEPIDVVVADRHARPIRRGLCLVAHGVIAGDPRVGGGVVVEGVVHRFGHRLVALGFVRLLGLGAQQRGRRSTRRGSRR